MAAWLTAMDGLNAATVAAFGSSMTYTPKDSAAVAIQGVLSLPHPEDQTTPVYHVVFVRVADLPVPPANGDEVGIDGETYRVFKVEFDNQGGANLGIRVRP